MSKSIFSKVAAVACSVAAVVAMSISASAASAEGKKLDQSANLKAGVTNLVATEVQVTLDELKAANYQVKYDVEVANNQGFGPSGIRLVYPSDSKFTVVLNEDEEPVTSPRDAVTGDLNNELTQNPDKFNVAVGYMGKKNTKGDGLMFYVDFKLPETAKIGDKFPMKIEVDKFLDKDNNKVDYNVVDGFIEIVDGNPNPVTTTVVTTTQAPAPATTTVVTTTQAPAPATTTVVTTTTAAVTTDPNATTTTGTGTTAAGKGTTTTKATTKANGVKTGDTGAGVAVAALLLAAGTAVVAAKKKED